MTSAKTPTDFNKIRAAFMQGLISPRVPPLAFKLAYLLAYRYANGKTQLCYPSQTTLAADLGTSIRTVQRLLDVLERHGLRIIRGDGRGVSSRYWIDPQRVTRVSSFTGRKGDKKRVTPGTKKGDTGVTRTKERTKIPSGEYSVLPQRDGERVALSRESDPSIGAGALMAPPNLFGELADPPEAKTETEPVAPKRTPEGELADGVQIQSSAVVTLNQEKIWRELRELWRRGHPSDDTAKAQAIARNAFAKACRDRPRSGPMCADILAGAKVWVAAYAAGDGVRFLPALPTWLAAHGWEKPPPKRRARANGHKAQRSNGYAKPDMFAICLEAGGYREDPDGNMFWPGDGGGEDDDAPLGTMMWGGGQ